MIRLFFILFLMNVITPPDALAVDILACALKCKAGTHNGCAALSYYMKNCSECSKVGSSCSAAFCLNNPNACDANGPLKNLSINTGEVKDDGTVLDVCLTKLFPPLTFEGHSNSDLNIINLNMLDIGFFAQTGGEALKRNVGTLRNLIANYLTYEDQRKGMPPPQNLSTYVDQWLLVKFKKNFNILKPFDFHMITNFIRREIYALKGIDTQTKPETFQGQSYPSVVSNLGCQGEKVNKS